jgi:hypothetical protein
MTYEWYDLTLSVESDFYMYLNLVIFFVQPWHRFIWMGLGFVIPKYLILSSAQTR